MDRPPICEVNRSRGPRRWPHVGRALGLQAPAAVSQPRHTRAAAASCLVSDLVFDQVGGRWIAVGLGSTQCNDAPVEVWVMFTPATATGRDSVGRHDEGNDQQLQRLQANRDLHPNRRCRHHQGSGPGRLAATSGVPRIDAARPLPRGDHLRERQFRTRTRRSRPCRPSVCAPAIGASACSTPPTGWCRWYSRTAKWTRDDVGHRAVQSRRHDEIKITAEYPLPADLQDPIPVLIGHGSNVSTGSACSGGDFEDKFTRTGD